MQLNADFHDRFEARTYAASVFHLLPGKDSDPNDERFRTFGDPVAMFDNAPDTAVEPHAESSRAAQLRQVYDDVGLSSGTRQTR